MVVKSFSLALIVFMGINPLNASANKTNEHDCDRHIVTSALTYLSSHTNYITGKTPHLDALFGKLKENCKIDGDIRKSRLEIEKYIKTKDIKELEDWIKGLTVDEKMIAFDSLIAMLCLAKDKNAPFDNYSLIQYWHILDRFVKTGVRIPILEELVKALKPVVESGSQTLFYARLKTLQNNKKLDAGLRKRLEDFINSNKDFQSADLTQKIILWRFAQNKKR